MSDKLFYAATIIDKIPPKFQVEFMTDYVKKPIKADALVHSSALKKGSSIAILDTVSQEYRIGDIVSINKYVLTDVFHEINNWNILHFYLFSEYLLVMKHIQLI